MSTYVNAPRNAVYTSYPATEKQISFLERLVSERLVDETLAADIAFELEQPSGPSKSGTSELIDDLMKLPYTRALQTKTGPKQQPLPDVPGGRYAIEKDGVVKFYRVDRPSDGKWAGWTFVKVQASDDFYPVKGAGAREVLDSILAAGTRAASVRYGHELGACGVCGRTLTDEDSRANGIGPICVLGWSN